MNTPYILEVENLLGGMGTIVYENGTEQFADLDNPNHVFSPRLVESELEQFCKDNIEIYRKYAQENQYLIKNFLPLPKINFDF